MDLSSRRIPAPDDEGLSVAGLYEGGEVDWVVGEVGVHGYYEVGFGGLVEGCLEAVSQCGAEAQFLASFDEGDAVVFELEALDCLDGSVCAPVVYDDYPGARGSESFSYGFY